MPEVSPPTQPIRIVPEADYAESRWRVAVDVFRALGPKHLPQDEAERRARFMAARELMTVAGLLSAIAICGIDPDGWCAMLAVTQEALRYFLMSTRRAERRQIEDAQDLARAHSEALRAAEHAGLVDPVNRHRIVLVRDPVLA